jgi:uncharacterized protein (TIGR00369 family)
VIARAICATPRFVNQGKESVAERCRAVCERFNAGSYYTLLGMTASSDAPGRSRVVLPFREALTQTYGGVHGGALLSLADAALNIALATTFENDETTATVDISMSFLAPAGRRDVEAEGVLTRRGRRLVFAECVLRAGGEEIARAKGICYVSRPRP